MRTLLTRRFAPLLLLVVLVGSACSSVSESPAASVKGHDISVSSVQDELTAIRSNSAYRAALEKSYGSSLAGTGKGTFDSAFTAQLLSLSVYYSLLEQSLDAQGVKITANDEQQASAAIDQQLGQLGKNVVKKFPADYRKQLARQEALIGVASREAASGAIGKKYFAAHKDEFTQACVSHILISNKTRSDAEAKSLADSLEAQLAAGADFATLAKANSDDPGSKDKGGDLDCGPKGRFVPAFDDAVFSQPVGVVGPPVKSDFGYHIILVKSRSAAKIGDVKQELGQAALNAYLLELTCGKGADVEVNPRYGRWDRSPCAGDKGLAQVTAPKAPKTNK